MLAVRTPSVCVLAVAVVEGHGSRHPTRGLQRGRERAIPALHSYDASDPSIEPTAVGLSSGDDKLDGTHVEADHSGRFADHGKAQNVAVEGHGFIEVVADETKFGDLLANSCCVRSASRWFVSTVVGIHFLVEPEQHDDVAHRLLETIQNVSLFVVFLPAAAVLAFGRALLHTRRAR